MYKYNLIISIFSKDNEVINIIKNVKESDKFTYNIDNYVTVNEDVIKKSDVILWDLDEPFKQYEGLVKKECSIIMCADSYKEEYENYSGIIIKPLDKNYAKFILRKVLDNIELVEDLEFSNLCLNSAIDSMPDMFWIKTLDGIHTVLNKEFCNVVKKTKEDVTGKDHYYIWNVSKDDPNSGADICKKTEDEVIEAGHMLSFQETVKIDDEVRQLVTFKAPLYDKFGKAIGTVGIGHDITDLKNMSIEMGILLNSMPYAVLLRDKNGKIQNVNVEFEKTFGLKKEDVIGQIYEEWADSIFNDDRQINPEGFKEASFNIGNDEKIVELRFDDIQDVFNNITGQVCIFRDVTTQRKLEDQIIKNSNIDFMTKLYNRRYLDKFISDQSEGCTLTLLSFDLDHFKSVNDTYGHKMGDEAIILAANTINDCFKNDLVVRMGGDEFLVVKVGSVELEDVGMEAENFINTLSNAFQSRKEFAGLSTSIGIAQGVFESNSLDILLNNADKAMYESKQNGRSCYTIYKG